MHLVGPNVGRGHTWVPFVLCTVLGWVIYVSLFTCCIRISDRNVKYAILFLLAVLLIVNFVSCSAALDSRNWAI